MQLLQSLTFPGGTKVTFGKEQGATDFSVAPSSLEEKDTGPPELSELSTQSMKILSTLWRYQKEQFGNDSSKRWTFAVSPVSPDYGLFLVGLSELINKSLVSVNLENHHCMLTNEGVKYAKDNKDELESAREFYTF